MKHWRRIVRALINDRFEAAKADPLAITHIDITTPQPNTGTWESTNGVLVLVDSSDDEAPTAPTTHVAPSESEEVIDISDDDDK